MITATCVACGKHMEPPYYVNFLEQTFCWPCADGEHQDCTTDCMHGCQSDNACCRGTELTVDSAVASLLLQGIFMTVMYKRRKERT